MIEWADTVVKRGEMARNISEIVPHEVFEQPDDGLIEKTFKTGIRWSGWGCIAYA